MDMLIQENTIRSMKKILCLFALTLVMTGCSDSCINRSVLQPVGKEELARLEKDYPNITKCYELATQARNRQQEKRLQNFSNLTYKQVYEFLVAYTNQENDIKEKIKEEWMQSYGGYELRLDSLHNNLSEWFETNKLESRVRITCIDVLPPPNDAKVWQTLTFYCNVKVENLTNEPIEDVKYELAICDTKKSAFGSVLSTTNTAEKADGSMYMAWSTSYGRTWTEDQESLLDYNQKELYEHYNIDYRIASLRQNGKFLTNDIIKSSNPNYEILSRQLWKTNKTASGRLHYLREAVKTLFDIDYLTLSEYHNVVIDSKVQSIDAESYNFLSAIISFKL